MRAASSLLSASALALALASTSAACRGEPAETGGFDDTMGDAGGAGEAGNPGNPGTPNDAGPVLAPEAAEDLSRDVVSTKLALDVAGMTGTATIVVAPSAKTGLTFEIGDLDIKSVAVAGLTAAKFAIRDLTIASDALQKRRLDIGVPAGTKPVEITITYAFKAKSSLDGWSPVTKLSFLWPYFCSNLFPCHSNPDDGSTFELAVTGVPAGQTAVYPAKIPADAPTYMPAIAIGSFAYTKIGTTKAGTEVGSWVLPAETTAAVATATSKLVDAFDWYETTLGPYRFGSKVGTVDAHWGPSGYGGMEHHPFFHVSSNSMADENTHFHEAAHGWYGDGIRIKCWEDFVLSEGTVTYLAARATETVHGSAAAQATWSTYRASLDDAVASGDTLAWPQTCNQIDILHDPLWSNIPYYKGAFFYRAVAAQVTVAKLDQILAKFYATWAGKAASMGDMIALIQAESGFDPAALVTRYLKSKGNPEL